MSLSENQNLPIQEPLPAEYETMSREELKQRLTIFIAEHLDNNFEKLCHMVYRHDVPEAKFHEALGTGSVQQQAEKIADLVIERELQKVETRKAYRQAKNDNSNFITD